MVVIDSMFCVFGIITENLCDFDDYRWTLLDLSFVQIELMFSTPNFSLEVVCYKDCDLVSSRLGRIIHYT